MDIPQANKAGFWRTLGRRFVEQHIVMMSGALTTTSLLAVVPVLVVLFSIISILPWAAHLHGLVQGFIFKNFLPEAGSNLQKYITLFVEQSRRLPVVSMIFLFIVSIMLTVSVEKSFNKIWQIKGRKFNIIAWLYYWLVLVLAGLIMLVALVGSYYLFSLPYVSQTLARFGGAAVAVNLIAFLLTVLAFTLLYKIVPHCKVKLWHAIISAVVVAILVVIVKYLFILYITMFPTYQVIYGALATVPIFIVWISLSWIIVLFGVLINSVLDQRRR